MENSTINLIDKIYRNQYCIDSLLPGPYGERYVTYADYIASGQPLRFIEDYIQNMVYPTYANTHTEASFTGLQTQHFREEARSLIKKSVNASSDDAVLFRGSGCTGAVDLLFQKLKQFYADQSVKPAVFIGPYEHHSNILPWREGDFELVEIPIAENGNVDLRYLENKLKEYYGKKPLIGSFSAASNVTGILAPVAEITNMLKSYGALSFWDYAGAGPYVQIDMNPQEGAAKDAVFISPHKFAGGPGSPGVLVVKKSLFEHGLPVITGGGTVHFVTKSQQRYFEEIEVREEGGTPAIIESIRAGMAFALKDQVGVKHIEEREENFVKRAFERFEKYPNVYVLGNLEQPRLAFLAFHIRYNNRFLHHNFVVALLNDLFGIQSRGGCSCAGPYGHDLLDLSDEKSNGYMQELDKGNIGSKPGWVRLSFNYFIPDAEFNYLLDCICWISEHGWKLLNEYHFDEDHALWINRKQFDQPLKELKNFLNENENRSKGSFEERMQIRPHYIEQATLVAEEAVHNWRNRSLQTYQFDQVENPLRWYSLAQDVEVGVLQ